MATGDGSVIGRIRQWFTPPPERRGYVDQILSQQLATAQGAGSVRDSGVYRACINLLGAAASTAELEGEHAEVLQPRLGDIVQRMMDTGQSAHEIIIGRSGQLELLPVEITNVQGGSEEESWFYTLARSGPMATMTVVREQAGVLNFRSRPSSRSPWRGTPALPTGNTTAAILGELEVQLGREARVKPTRVVIAASVREQRGDVEKSLQRGGIVTMSQALSTAVSNDPSGLKAGVIRNEASAPVVALYEQVQRAVCGALGVPPGLLLSGGDGAAAREDFRRFAAATIAPLLRIIAAEWETKIAPLTFNLDALRASDETARARALGSRANAVSKLVASGVELDEALLLAGVD